MLTEPTSCKTCSRTPIDEAVIDVKTAEGNFEWKLGWIGRNWRDLRFFC